MSFMKRIENKRADLYLIHQSYQFCSRSYEDVCDGSTSRNML